MPRPPLLSRRRAYGNVALAVFAMACTVAEGLNAQECTTRDPPCPENEAPVISISPSPGTVSGTDVWIQLVVTDDNRLDETSFQQTLTGATYASGTLSPHYNFSFSEGTATEAIRLAPGGTAQVWIRICDREQLCSTRTVTYSHYVPPPPPARGAPTVSLTPHNGHNRDARACGACADATLSYATPSYTSGDVPRSVTLVYSSAQAAPMGYVSVEASDNSLEDPTMMSLRLVRSSDNALVNWVNGPESFFASGDGASRLAGQFDMRGAATDAYDYMLEVRNWWSDASMPQAVPARVLIVNEKDSPFGWGWSLAGLQRLKVDRPDGGLVVTEGDGSIAFFARISCDPAQNCTYVAPAGDFSVLRRDGVLNKYTRRYPDGVVATFSADGRLESLQDRFAHATSFMYEGGLLREMQDPIGLKITLGYGPYGVYGAPGKLAWIRDPQGREAKFCYDAVGNLVTIVDPDGVTALQASYDANHRLEWHINRTGARTDIGYDAHGTVATMQDALVETTDAGMVRPTTLVRSLELATLPAAGKGSAAVPADRVLPTDAYAQLTTPRGTWTRMWPHRSGHPLRMLEHGQSGEEVSTTWQRDDSGMPRVYTPAQSSAIEMTWNGLLLMSAKQLFPGTVTTYTYEPTYGQLETASVDGVLVLTNYYSGNAVLDSTKVDTSVTRFTFDSRGRLLTMHDPEGHESRASYEATGSQNTAWVATVRAGVERRATFGYDAHGRQNSLTDPLGRIFTMNYDALNRLIEETGPDTSRVTYGYDDVLRRYTFTDALGQVYTDNLNALGWVVQWTDPRGKSRYLGYDRNGNLTRRTDRRGIVASYTYDNLDRIKTRLVDGKTTTFEYDPNDQGTWLVLANEEGIDSLRPSGFRRPAELVSRRGNDLHRYVIEWTYEDQDRRPYDDRDKRRFIRIRASDLMGPGGAPGPEVADSLSLGYDGADRLNYIARPYASIWKGTGITYNKDGLASKITLPTGASVADRLEMAFMYAAGHGIERLTFNRATIDKDFGRRYAYDVVDRIEHIRQRLVLANDTTFRKLTYTSYGRLRRYSDIRAHVVRGERICTGPQRTDCYYEEIPVSDTLRTYTYLYDRVGNRRDKGAVLGTGNRLTSFDGYALTYDDEGNLTSKSKAGWVQSYTWNGLGQLTAVTTNGSVVTYGYDGIGRRVRKTAGGQTTFYLHDGDNLIAEVQPGPTIKRIYAHYPGLDDPHSVRTGGQTYYYLTEHPRQVVGLVNESNVVVNKYEYTPYGESITTQEQIPQPLRFAGRELDGETGLYYMRARYYDPQLGRFISEDPAGQSGGANAYVYAVDDPVNLTDPLGLCPTRDYVRWGGDWHYVGPGPEAAPGESRPITPGGSRTAICGCDGKTWDMGGTDLAALQGCGKAGFRLDCRGEQGRCMHIIRHTIDRLREKGPPECQRYVAKLEELFANGKFEFGPTADYHAKWSMWGRWIRIGDFAYQNQGFAILQGDLGPFGGVLVHEAAHSIHGGHKRPYEEKLRGTGFFYDLERRCTV